LFPIDHFLIFPFFRYPGCETIRFPGNRIIHDTHIKNYDSVKFIVPTAYGRPRDISGVFLIYFIDSTNIILIEI